jgi:hypothetical protein
LAETRAVPSRDKRGRKTVTLRGIRRSGATTNTTEFQITTEAALSLFMQLKGIL